MASRLASRLVTNSMCWSIENKRLDNTSALIHALSLQEEIKKELRATKDLSRILRSKRAKPPSEIFAVITPVTFFCSIMIPPHKLESTFLNKKKGGFITQVNTLYASLVLPDILITFSTSVHTKLKTVLPMGIVTGHIKLCFAFFAKKKKLLHLFFVVPLHFLAEHIPLLMLVSVAQCQVLLQHPQLSVIG